MPCSMQSGQLIGHPLAQMLALRSLVGCMRAVYPPCATLMFLGRKVHTSYPLLGEKKLDDNSKSCYFLGVLPDGNGVKVLDSTTRKIVKTCDAIFEESVIPSPELSRSSKPLSKPSLQSPWIYP